MALPGGDIVLFRAQARLLLTLAALMWMIHFVNVGYWLSWAFGIRPKNIWGLVGILFSPLLHWSWRHLTGNTTAFLILGWFVSLQGIHLFYLVTLVTAIFGGFGVWLFGNPRRVSAGASGVIYGYMGFLLIYGITSGNLAGLIVAVATACIYSPLIIGTERHASGMLPRPDSSFGWQAHLYGFIGGALIAFYLSDLRLN